MKTVKTEEITELVKNLLIKANTTLPDDAVSIIEKAAANEDDRLQKSIFNSMRENIAVAKEKNIPVCQDTGMAVIFAEVGCGVCISGGDFEGAVNEGVRKGYAEGMRFSVVSEPVYERINTNDNTPAVIYTRLVGGDDVKISVMPKGFGAENMSAIKMFTPSATEDDICAFVCETVKKAGGNPCPPLFIGVGIGGTFDYAAYLSKKALLCRFDLPNPDPRYAALEKRLLSEVNQLGIGAQGFGGKTTALGLNIEFYPTHIAGLPVAVNICCHVVRHAEGVI